VATQGNRVKKGVTNRQKFESMEGLRFG
jgi:hypothetical protein